MKATRLGRCIVFGDFELYPDAGELLKFGHRITQARPQEVRLLTLLVERAGVKVSKEEIHAKLWPGEIPSKNRLNVVVSNARAALSDTNQDDRKYIASLGADGYCFVHPITRVIRATGDCNDREAEQAYRSGRHALDNRQESSLRVAVAHFKQAIDRNPSYVDAWVGLANAQIMMGIHCVEAPEFAFLKAQAAAEEAIRIEPAKPEAITALAWVKLCYDRDRRTANALFGEALRARRDYAFAHNGLALLYLVTDQLDRNLEAIERARKLSPLSPPLQALYCNSLCYTRRYEEAITAGLQAIASDPHSAIAHGTLSHALLCSGEYERALKHLAEARRLSNNSKVYLGFWGYASARAGKHADAEAALAQLLATPLQEYVPSYFVGVIHHALGRHQEAITWLDRACAERTHWVLFLNVEPMFDDLRGTPAFEQLLQKVGINERLSIRSAEQARVSSAIN